MTTTKHQELHRTRQYSIGINDPLNFYAARLGYVDDLNSKRHGEETLTDKNYFPTLAGALQYVARQVAAREAKSLDGYITAYQIIAKELVAACQGA